MDMLDTQEETMRLTHVSASSQRTRGHKRVQVVVGGGGWGQKLPRREARETRAGNLETGKAPGGPKSQDVNRCTLIVGQNIQNSESSERHFHVDQLDCHHTVSASIACVYRPTSTSYVIVSLLC